MSIAEKDIPAIAFNRLLVYHSTFMKSIAYDEIAILLVENRLSRVFTNCGAIYSTSRTMNELEQKLPVQNFFRVNRNCIVSFDSISRVEHYFNHRLVIFTKCHHIEKIIVSRPRVAAFKDWLGD